MQELVLYKSAPQMSYHHLLVEVLQSTTEVTLILCSENYAHYHHLLLKQGLKIDELIKKGKLQVIDIFSQNVQNQQELPITENTPKMWIDPIDKEAYQVDLLQYLKNKIKYTNVIVENLLYLDIQCRERKIETINLLSQLMQSKSLHIYAPIVNMTSYSQLLVFLTKHATKLVTLMPNQSGFSRDMDGQMLIEIRSQDKPTYFQRCIYQLDGNNVKYLSALQII